MHACNGTYKHGFLSETQELKNGAFVHLCKGISVVKKGTSVQGGFRGRSIASSGGGLS